MNWYAYSVNKLNRLIVPSRRLKNIAFAKLTTHKNFMRLYISKKKGLTKSWRKDRWYARKTWWMYHRWWLSVGMPGSWRMPPGTRTPCRSGMHEIFGSCIPADLLVGRCTRELRNTFRNNKNMQKWYAQDSGCITAYLLVITGMPASWGTHSGTTLSCRRRTHEGSTIRSGIEKAREPTELCQKWTPTMSTAVPGSSRIKQQKTKRGEGEQNS